MKRVLLAVLVAVFLLGACGDDGDGGAGGSAAREELVESLTDNEDGFAVTDDEAGCVADSMIADIGEERISEIDFEADTPDFTAEEAAFAADAFASCADLSSLVAQSITADEDVSEESVQCLGENLDDGAMRDFLEAGFTDPESIGMDVLTSIDTAMQDCFTEDEYAAINE
jgi:hypothetical protein